MLSGRIREIVYFCNNKQVISLYHPPVMRYKSVIKVLLTAACCILSPAINAEDETHHRVGFNGALTSSYSWQLEFSYHYMFHKCVGVGGSAGTWAVYFGEGWASGNNWSIDDDDNEPWNLYLRPSALLKTPPFNYRACSWSLFADPGLMLNIPYRRVCIESTHRLPAIDYEYVSTAKGQWLAVDIRLGVSLDMGPCGISAGYLMSNLDVYSQQRHLSYKGVSFDKFYPKKSFMQGGYISCSYTF